MLIWTLAIVLLVGFGVIGFYLGAARLTVSLFGLLLGAMLAMPLAPAVQPLMGLIKVTHPMWSVVWPPIIVLLLVYFVFIGISFFVHRKIDLHFKYHSDDLSRFRWERINSRLGTCLGFGMGGVWVVILGLMIYIAGYVTVQVAASDEGNPSWMRYLNQARHNLNSSGLDRVAAKFDPMPSKYYEAADIIGLIYNNPIVLSRLAQYPPFLSLGEQPEFQDIATDSEFSNMLLSKGDIVQMVQHPKSLTIINNGEIRGKLLSQDLGDLQQYLNTGISPKFADERILGRWYIDSYATLTAERKKRPDITASEMRSLKKEVMETMRSVEFMATPENQVSMRVPSSSSSSDQGGDASDPNSDQSQRGENEQSPDFAQRLAERDRYGLAPGPGAQGRGVGPNFSRGQGGGQGQRSQQASTLQKEPEQVLTSAEGSWRRDGSDYKLQLRSERTGSVTANAIATEDTLTIQIQTPSRTLIFTRST